ncbi:MAG TPA: hypothetical protein VFR31_00660 [Thermoanaerobaculia bacterium]|nr:hypothetical protein [Thermoanaerobaculia bacterium]
MRIAFVSLFLGLTLGAYPVELAVEGPVSAVELLLDGAVVGRMEAAPWSGRIDFGSALVPHELVARALDADGQEVARARQWINLPRPEAEVEILLEGAPLPSSVRLAFQSRTGEAPTSILVSLDGQPLVVGPDNRAPLPAWDPESAHVLSAEVRFPSNMVARKDAVFGGKYGSEVSTDLTAVPVRALKGKLTKAALQGRLLAEGKPLPVAAVEEDPAEVFLVRDLGSVDGIRKLAGAGGKRRTEQGIGMQKRLGIESDYLRYEIGLRKDDEVRFVRPVTRTFSSSSGPRVELFDWSRPFKVEDGGLYWLLTRVVTTGNVGEQRLADAVAVAGLQAMAGSRPRAVVLILGGDPKDVSRYDPATVRRYLAAIRVPLFVWTFDGSSVPSGWGEAENVSNVTRLRRAVAKLKDEIESQRIVWVEGVHLPQSIALAPGTPEIELP